MIQKILGQIILKKQIQKQTGITKQILPGDVAKAESKAKFAIESLQNRGNINVNNLTKSDLEFIAEDIVNPFKNAEKTIVKQSAEILPFRFKRSFAEELADASKKGDFKRMRGIMSVDPKFKEVIESLKRSKAEEKAYKEMVGPKKLIPDRDVIPFQSPEVQKLSPEEKLARTTLTEDQYKDVLKKGKTLDDVIYAQDFYGDTADDVITKITEGEKFPFAGGGVAGMLGERQNFKMGRRAFLKMLAGTGAGIAGLKTGIAGLGGKKAATEVATEAVKSAGSSAPPPYFFKLVEKIKFMGDKRKTPSYKERVDEYTYRGKDGSDYELIEDLDTGDIKITKDKTGVGTYGDKSFDTIEDRTEMVFKKGQADETTKGKKPPDEYEEYKVEFDQDGTAADATDIDELSKKELIEEAGDTESLTLKRAGGGVAYMLGQ